MISTLVANGRLRIARERVASHTVAAGKITVISRGAADRTFGPFDAAFDCTGIWTDLSRCGAPLIAAMIAGRVATYDELFMGLRTDTAGRILSGDGVPHSALYALGSLRRGTLWETTAVRELRQQAGEIANASAKPPTAR